MTLYKPELVEQAIQLITKDYGLSLLYPPTDDATEAQARDDSHGKRRMVRMPKVDVSFLTFLKLFDKSVM